MKVLRVEMPDGSKWDVPADIIAYDRAGHYYSRDAEPEEYEDEFKYTMSSEHELRDWAADNMNWEDVEKYAQKVNIKNPSVDYQEGWVNGEKEVLEI